MAEKNTLILAPMLGYTDHIFRNVFIKHFSGFSYAIAPYIITNTNNKYKNSLLNRVEPKNNNLYTISQILSNNPEQFIELANHFIDMGHKEINWNLGCPYPRIINKNLGSGLLEHPQIIDDLLQKVEKSLKVNISIKLRIGLKNKRDIFKIIPILNNYPIKNITIHPRTGSQMYKGQISMDIFEEITDNLNHEIIYNGDINSVSSYNKIQNKFKNISKFMIGRAILSNPFLIEEINGTKFSKEEKLIKLKNYHNDLLINYAQFFAGDSHLFTRMKEIWFYLSDFFEDKKFKKKLKKSKNLDTLKGIINSYL